MYTGVMFVTAFPAVASASAIDKLRSLRLL